jgi:hypothetical protein
MAAVVVGVAVATFGMAWHTKPETQRFDSCRHNLLIYFQGTSSAHSLPLARPELRRC